MRDFPIIDAHQHFWDLEQNYYPWLCDEPLIPFRYGDYRSIRRIYSPDDYLWDSREFHIVGTVHVEGEWNPADPVGESRWLQGVTEQSGLPSAIVAQAWLDREDVAEVLAAQAGFANVRGVRHKPKAVSSPEEVLPGATGSMGDTRWRDGYAVLAKHDLSFDLQTPFWHLPEASALARDFPHTQIILNHTGLPADRSEQGLKAWRGAMDTLADEANVAVKLSGIGVPGAPWTVEANGPIVLDTIAMFGVERCMFASNFPVDGLVADFATIFGGFMKIVEGFDDSDKRKLFHDNAMRIYRIDPETLVKRGRS